VHPSIEVYPTTYISLSILKLLPTALAPTLILYEVANALRFHRTYKISAQTILRAMLSLRDFITIVEPNEDVWRKTLDLSIEDNLSVYDAVYAALASHEKIPLITGDLNLYGRLRNKIEVFTLKEM
jgi:predicted nucleic acid-binding protein